MSILFSVIVMHPDVQSNNFDVELDSFSDLMNITFYHSGSMLSGSLRINGTVYSDYFIMNTYEMLYISPLNDYINSKFILDGFRYVFNIISSKSNRLIITDISGNVVLTSLVHDSFNVIETAGILSIQNI